MKEIKLEMEAYDDLHLDPKKAAEKGKSIRNPDFPTYYLTIDGEICSRSLPGHPISPLFNSNRLLNSVRLTVGPDIDTDNTEIVFLEELIITSFFQPGVYDPSKHGIIHRDGNVFNTNPFNLKVVPLLDHQLYVKNIKEEVKANAKDMKVDLYTSSYQFSRRKVITNISVREASRHTMASIEQVYLMAKLSKEHGIDIERSKFTFLPVGHTLTSSATSLDDREYLVYWNNKDEKKRKLKIFTKVSELASIMCVTKRVLETTISTHINRISSDVIMYGNNNPNIELWMEKDFKKKHKDLYDTVLKLQ